MDEIMTRDGKQGVRGRGAGDMKTKWERFLWEFGKRNYGAKKRWRAGKEILRDRNEKVINFLKYTLAYPPLFKWAALIHTW